MLGVTPEVVERAVKIRREMKMKLPYAIIFAMAQEAGRILVTRNVRDFGASSAGVRSHTGPSRDAIKDASVLRDVHKSQHEQRGQ